eukprot:CAMPEP_0196811498 /NCGR_PEP_ID=MMETSP1362-20130617/18009_1 /TAXON_ID=163516 /ORGANISM="Leptocylindrus danicus, Strain CCMP1856" /LENGTH=374 /DNA_ID=CAMNT_0042186807 /DNA_START=55 /DNA_END=1176 /DNA_ORIENTATION=+
MSNTKHAFTAVPMYSDDEKGFVGTSKHDANVAKSSGSVTVMDGSTVDSRGRAKLHRLGAIAISCALVVAVFLPCSGFSDWIVGLTSGFSFCVFPTKSSGGGRDWILNDDGTIAAKHQTDLVLGLGKPPMVLVDRGSERQFVFDDETILALKGGEYVTLTTASGQGIGKKETREEYATVEGYTWRYIEAEVHKNATQNTMLVRYENDNFIMVVNDNMAFDVSYWVYEAGNTVNFVGGNDIAATKIAGGGRDWVINVEDGTISPKSATHLALGSGASALVLVEKGHSRQIVMDNMEGLMNGETISASLSSPGDGDLVLSKKYEDEKMYQFWHYIESIALNVEEKAIHIRYEDENYLRLVNADTGEDEDLVFDVSYW